MPLLGHAAGPGTDPGRRRCRVARSGADWQGVQQAAIRVEAISSGRDGRGRPCRVLAARPPSRGLQRLHLGVVVRGADVLDNSAPAAGGPHDLDRGRPPSGLHGANVVHPTSL
jgi:hypothetical protein